jgi:hypothetical protein
MVLNSSKTALFLPYLKAQWKRQPSTNLNTNNHVVSHKVTMQVIHASIAQLSEPSCEATSETVVVVGNTPTPVSHCILGTGVTCTTAESPTAFRTLPCNDVRQRCCRHGVKKRCFTVHCKREVTGSHCWLAKCYGSGRHFTTLML